MCVIYICMVTPLSNRRPHSLVWAAKFLADLCGECVSRPQFPHLPFTLSRAKSRASTSGGEKVDCDLEFCVETHVFHKFGLNKNYHTFSFIFLKDRSVF